MRCLQLLVQVRGGGVEAGGGGLIFQFFTFSLFIKVEHYFNNIDDFFWIFFYRNFFTNRVSKINQLFINIFYNDAILYLLSLYKSFIKNDGD